MERGVPKEVDMSDLLIFCMCSPVRAERSAMSSSRLSGRDKLNPVVKDQFATRVFQPSLAFQQAGHEQEDGVWSRASR